MSHKITIFKSIVLISIASGLIIILMAGKKGKKDKLEEVTTPEAKETKANSSKEVTNEGMRSTLSSNTRLHRSRSCDSVVSGASSADQTQPRCTYNQGGYCKYGIICRETHTYSNRNVTPSNIWELFDMVITLNHNMNKRLYRLEKKINKLMDGPKNRSYSQTMMTRSEHLRIGNSSKKKSN